MSEPLAVQIPLYAPDGTVAAYTFVDSADADWVSRWRWGLDGWGYAYRSESTVRGSRVIRLHRELLGLKPGDRRITDHIDRDKLNNRRANLRAIPKGMNGQNLPSFRGSTSQFRGVSWDANRRKWLACARLGGKTVNLGRHLTETDAAEAARAARLREMPYAVD